MDVSDYPSSHCNYDNTQRKVLGKFKDEMNGNIITEFIALTPKMYAFQVEGQTEQKNKRCSEERSKKKRINFDLCKKRLKKIMYSKYNLTASDLTTTKYSALLVIKLVCQILKMNDII